MMKRFFYGIAIAVLAVFAFSCNSDEKNARVEVWLTDAPGDFQEVNVEVLGVEINAGEGEQGWKSLDVDGGVINLLDLTNGFDTLLGSIEVPAGKVSQIRLKLGDDNSLKVDNQTFSMTVPSGSQSGLKLNVHETLVEGVTYKFLLDFDVAKSVVRSGNGDYKLKPVIRAITEAVTGAIKGQVDPKESTPAIYAIQDQDTVGTTFSDSTGQFLLRGLPAGNYNVVFSPNGNYQVVEKTDVSVQVGVVKDLGTIEIPEQ